MKSKHMLYRSCFLLFASICFFACTAQDYSLTGTDVPDTYTNQDDSSTRGAQGNSSVIANTPTPCAGWNCTIKGIVYGGSIEESNTLVGVPIKFRQIS